MVLEGNQVGGEMSVPVPLCPHILRLHWRINQIRCQTRAAPSFVFYDVESLWKNTVVWDCRNSFKTGRLAEKMNKNEVNMNILSSLQVLFHKHCAA